MTIAYSAFSKTNVLRVIAAITTLLCLSFSVFASEGIKLDKAPINVRDAQSLQRGAQVFVNNCLSCHSAQAMRYNRLKDIGLSEEQIKNNLMLVSDSKIGDTMQVGMQAKEAAAWFGAAPPDLSVIGRARGADYLYTYLRSFYRDASRPTGWNNAVFDKVGMPHVLGHLQGDLTLRTIEANSAEAEAKDVVRSWEVAEIDKAGKPHTQIHQLVLTHPGELTRLINGQAYTVDYDNKVTDLVNFLMWMSDPSQITRQRIGYGVMIFLLFLLIPITYLLKKEYWKDVH